MNIQSIIKMTWIAFAIIGMHTYANVKFIQDDLVGTWKCSMEYQYDDGVMRVITLDKIRADGTMTQFWEVNYHDQIGYGSSIEIFVITNNWKFSNNRLKLTNNVIKHYRGFDNQNIPYPAYRQDMYKTLNQESFQDEDYQIEIIDRNHLNYIIENDDFITNFSYCQRML